MGIFVVLVSASECEHHFKQTARVGLNLGICLKINKTPVMSCHDEIGLSKACVFSYVFSMNQMGQLIFVRTCFTELENSKKHCNEVKSR